MNKLNQYLSQAKSKFATFMYGRYGIDRLYYGLMIVWLILLVLNILISGSFASMILSVLSFAVLIVMLLRVFSKNTLARSKENAWYLNTFGGVRGKFSLWGKMWRDRKTHRYKKCPHCKALMRLPYQKGTHTALCPKCSKTFKVKL